MYDPNKIFQSYREFVALCIESGDEIPTITEFTGSNTPMRNDEEDECTYVPPALPEDGDLSKLPVLDMNEFERAINQ